MIRVLLIFLALVGAWISGTFSVMGAIHKKLPLTATVMEMEINAISRKGKGSEDKEKGG